LEGAATTAEATRQQRLETAGALEGAAATKTLMVAGRRRHLQVALGCPAGAPT
jgi:hypothetical protein